MHDIGVQGCTGPYTLQISLIFFPKQRLANIIQYFRSKPGCMSATIVCIDYNSKRARTAMRL
jgi:hypothetical protein